MEKFAGKYRIESNRWKLWDYSSPAHYFITICTENRECIFGNVENGKMKLSEYGQIVETEIKKIPGYHKRALVDIGVVMPNHIHLIVTLGYYDFDNGVAGRGDIVGNNNRVGLIDPVDKITFGEGFAVHEFYLHEFYLQPVLTKPSWLLTNPTPDEIKQYRKQRRNMLYQKYWENFNNKHHNKLIFCVVQLEEKTGSMIITIM